MATEAQLLEGLKRADAAGETADAQAFADAIKAMRAAPPAKTPIPPSLKLDKPDNQFSNIGAESMEDAGIRTNNEKSMGMLLHLMPAGLGDEMAATEGARYAAERGGSFSDELNKGLTEARGAKKGFDEAHPMGALGLDFAASAPLMALGGVPKTLAKTAIQGAVPAAAYGFGEGEGGLANRATSGAISGATGAVLGGTLGGAGALVNRAGRALARPNTAPLADVLAPTARNGSRPPPFYDENETTVHTGKRAADYVTDLVRRSGKTPEELAGLTHDLPKTGAEEISSVGIGHLGAFARRGGLTGPNLEGQIAARESETNNRILQKFADVGVNPDAAQGNIESIVDVGRKEAAPLYKAAFSGGSTAPLKIQFRRELKAAQGQEETARRAVSSATKKPSLYKQRTAEWEAAKGRSQQVADRLAKAEADGTANAPGAVWSPRIQEFLDDSDIQAGIARGVKIQKDEALAAGVPFKPSEYAIVSGEGSVNPTVGSVPNMRLLDAAKRGLDATIRDAAKNALGNPMPKAKWGEGLRALDNKRKAYVAELKRLNPGYAKALERGSDYLSASEAHVLGGQELFADKITGAQVAKRVAAMSDPNRAAYVGGIANKIFNDVQNGKLNLKSLSTPAVRAKLSASMGAQNAGKFLAHVKEEVAMKASGARLKSNINSPTMQLTQAVKEQDEFGNRPPVSDELMSFGADLMRGRPIAAITKAAARGAAGVASRYRTAGMTPEVRDEAGRILSLRGKELGDYLMALNKAQGVKHPVIEDTAKQLARVLRGSSGAAGVQGQEGFR